MSERGGGIVNRATPSRFRITRAPSGWYHYQDIPPIDDYDGPGPTIPAPHPGFVTQPSLIIRLSLRLSAWWDRTLAALFTR